MNSELATEQFALVTGGSSGIGKAIALELAKLGYSLVLVSNNQNELDNCLPEFGKTKCIPICMDLAKIHSATELFKKVSSLSISIEILVNNAGILVFSEVCDTMIQKVDSILHLHMNTPAMLCRLFGGEMIKNKSGYILNVSSISSVMPFPGISLYGPTKTFLRYFTRALRYELKPHGVQVCCLIPGATETALYDPNRVNLKLARKLGVMQSPAYVAQKAVKALFQNDSECIPGFLNKLTVFFVPLVPKGIIYLIHKKTGLTKKGVKALA